MLGFYILQCTSTNWPNVFPVCSTEHLPLQSLKGFATLAETARKQPGRELDEEPNGTRRESWVEVAVRSAATSEEWVSRILATSKWCWLARSVNTHWSARDKDDKLMRSIYLNTTAYIASFSPPCASALPRTRWIPQQRDRQDILLERAYDLRIAVANSSVFPYLWSIFSCFCSSVDIVVKKEALLRTNGPMVLLASPAYFSKNLPIQTPHEHASTLLCNQRQLRFLFFFNAPKTGGSQ